MVSKVFVVVALLGFSVKLVMCLMGFGLDGKSMLFREPPFDMDGVDTRAAQTAWIEQRLDHFDPCNNKTWKMRYMYNGEFFEDGGPIYIFLGGEWAVTPYAISAGIMYDIGRETNGYLFTTEHRYYGESLPTIDASTENLRYLNVRQALADVAHLIVHIRETFYGLQGAPVILYGGSYSATMAIWMRQTYPELIAGAVASSGPILAKLDFFHYKEVVGYAVQLLGGAHCYNAIANGFLAAEMLYDNQQFSRLEQVFNLCEPLGTTTEETEKWSFFDNLAVRFSHLVQSHTGNNILNACNKILSGKNALLGVAAFVRGYSQSCILTNYTKFVEFYRQESWGSPATDVGRQWLHQTCAEYGWYHSSTSPYQPFGSSFPADLYVRACRDIFGKSFTPEKIQANIDETNRFHHGLRPEVTNVYFTQGQFDPWRPMGVQKDINDDSPAVVIPMVSHCADLGSISSSDSDEMVAAKQRGFDLVWKWLGIETQICRPFV